MLEPENIEIDDAEPQEAPTPPAEKPISAVETPDVVSKAKVFLEGIGTAVIGKGGPSSWGVLEHSDRAAAKNAGKGSRKRREPSLQVAEDENSSSEEEELVVLQPEDTRAGKQNTAGAAEG
ncbi:hypothetical protein MTO96_010248 [Rhipicephalus appendiculatus]